MMIAIQHSIPAPADSSPFAQPPVSVMEVTKEKGGQFIGLHIAKSTGSEDPPTVGDMPDTGVTSWMLARWISGLSCR